MLRMACYGKSDTGRKRSNNEDAFLVNSDLGLAVLADGMGGAAAGELASRFFTEAALEMFTWMADRRRSDSVSTIEKSFDLANRRIRGHVQENPDHHGMGCTAELLAMNDRSYCLGHVGDSRTYLFRNGQLTQLTRDHSFVQDLLEKGVITSSQARTHRMRHVILRAVGTEEALAVDLLKGEALPGDVFLLCSDGLTDMVEDETIRQILTMPEALSHRAMMLVDAANAAGGHDNVTVVLCEVIAESSGPDRFSDQQLARTEPSRPRRR